MRAVYYIGTTPREGVVLGEGEGPDGKTVTLADSAGDEPFVRAAPVSIEPRPGHAVIKPDEPEPKKKPKKIDS